MVFASIIILEVMFTLGLTPSKMMQYLGPPSELVQGRVQPLLIVELILMEMWDEGKEE